MEPGKNADGYWGGQDVVKHLQNVIPLLQQIHPNCQLVFVFDNSSTHGCWPADALDANVLNLNPPPLEPRKRKAATSGLEPGEGAVAQPQQPAKVRVPMRDGWYCHIQEVFSQLGFSMRLVKGLCRQCSSLLGMLSLGKAKVPQ
jgi:hypothetical protein